MNNILTDDKTGQQYMFSPSSQELERGIIQYVPELHAQLWSYIQGQLYSVHPDLIDWDQGVEEWKEDIMRQWPFGIQPTTDQRLLEEALNCLDFLDSYLQFEEWEIDQIEAQEEKDDDEGDVDKWDFGIAPLLWHIQL